MVFEVIDNKKIPTGKYDTELYAYAANESTQNLSPFPFQKIILDS